MHIKDKPIISTQKNKPESNDEIIDDENVVEFEEDNITSSFTLTQSKNDNGLTFTECANDSRVL